MAAARACHCRCCVAACCRRCRLPACCRRRCVRSTPQTSIMSSSQCPPLQIWYCAYFSSLSALFPFIPLFFRLRGLDERQIGVVAALRPWLSLPAGAAWSAAADKTRHHRVVLLITFSCSALARLGLWAGRSFPALLAISLATELFAAPVTILADSAVLAACSEEGDYGRQRLWG